MFPTYKVRKCNTCGKSFVWDGGCPPFPPVMSTACPHCGGETEIDEKATRERYDRAEKEFRDKMKKRAKRRDIEKSNCLNILTGVK